MLSQKNIVTSPVHCCAKFVSKIFILKFLYAHKLGEETKSRLNCFIKVFDNNGHFINIQN